MRLTTFTAAGVPVTFDSKRVSLAQLVNFSNKVGLIRGQIWPLKR